MQVVVHTRYGYCLMTSTTGAEVQLRLGATATLEGERRIGRDGEQGSGGFFVWETAEAALAAAVALHGQHFATPWWQQALDR